VGDVQAGSVEDVQAGSVEDVRAQVLESRDGHPVLNRLRAQLDSSPAETIGRYDRMHHRHNRS
jgi:hypothetical protein